MRASWLVFLAQVEVWRRDAREIAKNCLNESIVDVLARYKDGWRAAQSRDVATTQYHVQWWWKEGDTRTERPDLSVERGVEVLNQGQCEAILKSEFFRPADDGYRIIWELDL